MATKPKPEEEAPAPAESPSEAPAAEEAEENSEPVAYPFNVVSPGPATVEQDSGEAEE